MKQSKNMSPFLAGLTVGIFGLTFIAFTAGWIVTSGYANEMASISSEKKLVDRLASICVAQFGESSGQAGHRAAIKAAGFHGRDDLVKANGWATMPDEQKADAAVIKACAVGILNFTG
jgi:hypothetical protein